MNESNGKYDLESGTDIIHKQSRHLDIKKIL
jgi:hypothetical protein